MKYLNQNIFYVLLGTIGIVVLAAVIVIYARNKIYKTVKLNSNYNYNYNSNSNIELFSNKTKYPVNDNGQPVTSWRSKYCQVTIIINAPSSDDDKMASVKTELTKLSRSLGNLPVVGIGRMNTLKLTNPDTSLFQGWKIKIIDEPLASGEIGSSSSGINIVTNRHNVFVKNVFNDSDSTPLIILKLINFLGIQSDYS